MHRIITPLEGKNHLQPVTYWPIIQLLIISLTYTTFCLENEHFELLWLFWYKPTTLELHFNDNNQGCSQVTCLFVAERSNYHLPNIQIYSKGTL